MPDLEYIAIWTELDMEVAERCGDQAERQRKFKNFVEFLFDEEGALLVRSEDEDLELSTRIDCNLWVPLYEMNKNYHSPRRRHLKQGVAPLAGLPEWDTRCSMSTIHWTVHSTTLSYTMAKS
jgi:hypothetical protein